MYLQSLSSNIILFVVRLLHLQWRSTWSTDCTTLQVLSPYSTGNRVRVGYPSRMKSTHKKRNVHGQRKRFAFGTQRNLYSTGSRWGFALGDTKNVRHPTQNIPTCWYILRWVTQNSGVGCIAQRQPLTPGILHHSGI